MFASRESQFGIFVVAAGDMFSDILAKIDDSIGRPIREGYDLFKNILSLWF